MIELMPCHAANKKAKGPEPAAARAALGETILKSTLQSLLSQVPDAPAFTRKIVLGIEAGALVDARQVTDIGFDYMPGDARQIATATTRTQAQFLSDRSPGGSVKSFITRLQDL
jgi:hypothetical protein